MIEPLIVALRQIKPDLTSDQIADILWLALQRQQIVGVSDKSASESTNREKPIEPDPVKPDPADPVKPDPADPVKPDPADSVKPDPADPVKPEEKVSVYPKTAERDKDDRPIRVVDVPSLRDPLPLTRALKSLMKRVPFGEPVLLDEAATVRRIAEEQLWLPILTAPLEPWLEVAVVIDESPSMRMLWQKTLRDLKKILEHYGAFRDVQTWGLVTVSNPSSTSKSSDASGTAEQTSGAQNEQSATGNQRSKTPHEVVKIRRGVWTKAYGQQYRDPKALIDPNGRRLILVVSDCVSSMWNEGGSVFPALDLWASRGPVAIMQVLPTWLWSRTRLEDAIDIEVCSREPGIANQYLQAKALSCWDEDEFQKQEEIKKTKIKIPVFSLAPSSASAWSQMVMGRGSVWSRGIAFKKPSQSGLTTPPAKDTSIGAEESKQADAAITPEERAKERVQQFRMSSSPTARKLAGFLAASPVISLPVVRLLQFTMLKESQQAHVAEVFLGGLLKAIYPIPIKEDTNPEEVLYDFDTDVREIVLDMLPTVYQITVLEEISKYVEEWLGKASETFNATLSKTGVQPFAEVRKQLLDKFRDGYLRELLDKVAPPIFSAEEEVLLTPEERVQKFYISSSPIARKLADFLAVSPVISLPVMRLLQFTMLPESQQAHVDEVLLSGLLKAIYPVPITEDTNPEEVLYDFIEGVREIFLDTLPTVDQVTVLEEISKYVEEWLGKSPLSTFSATVKENETDASRDALIKPFAVIREQLINKFKDSDRLSGLLSKVAPDLNYKQVLQNGDASKELEGWEIIENGGDGWLVEHGPGAECPATPGDTNFVTSYEWCRKSQLIDLLKAGLTVEELDRVPEINISDWMCARSDCESQYYLKVELRDVNQQVLETFETGEVNAPLEPGWKHPFQKVEHTFRDYGENLRFIYFEHGGKDKKRWAGHYGSKMTGAAVKVFLHLTSARSSDAVLLTKDQAERVFDTTVDNSVLDDLNHCLKIFAINTPARMRHFLAQIAHESGGLQHLKETSRDGFNYEGRKDLGNDNPGDGSKYKGAGAILLVGRAEYQAFSNWIKDPRVMEGCDYVATTYPVTSAGFWWHNNDMNALCNAGASVRDVTRRVNGGFLGLDSRESYYERALSVFPGFLEEIGDCLSFDGQSNYVNLGKPDILNFAGQITLEAWIKPENTTKTQNIVAHGYKRDPDAEVFLRIAEGEHEYQIGSWNGGDHRAGYPIPDEDLGNWVHLAGSYDGTTWRLYRNGEQVSESIDPVGALQVSENWAIAAAGNGKERFFQGQIGEVRLWKRACSQEEIQENRLRRLKGDELGLVGYWILDEAQATIVPDRTANGNHGRVVQVEALQLQTGDRISLKADNGKYWNYAASGRSGNVDAIEVEADVASDESLFKVERLADGKIALQASNEKYLTLLFTNRESITASGDSSDSTGSQFTLESWENHKIALRAGNSKYLSRINYGGGSGFNTVEATKATRDMFCEFEINKDIFNLQTFEFDIVEFVEDPLLQFEFEVPTVNAQGKEIRREQRQASYFEEALGDVALQMIAIPAGSFQMGSPKKEPKRSGDESPQHQVTVPAFFMGRYAVTQAQWKAVAAMPRVHRDLELDPSSFKGDDRPAESVSWQDAMEFCDRLSAHTEQQYRLPSEAEWEYACRAGTTTPFHFGETLTAALANYDGTQIYRKEAKGEKRAETARVGSFLPNAFGLYDMHGNVWEWCADHWHENYEGAPTDGSAWIRGGDPDRCVLRGGSWALNPERCRSAFRLYNDPVIAYNSYGFRVVSSASRA